MQQVLVIGSADGKDSGDLKDRGYTEASYLAELIVAQGVSPELILIEGRANNGAENTRFGLTSLADTFSIVSLDMLLILVARPASLLRLSHNHHMITWKEYHRAQVSQLVLMP